MESITGQTSPKILRMLIVALAFLLSPPAICVGDEVIIDHQATARQYLMHPPSGGENSIHPLVIYLHGLRPAYWKNHEQTEINAAADREGFVAV